MPIYTIRCATCERIEDVYRRLSDYDNLPDCCGRPMSRVICAPMVQADIQPYRSQIDGKMIMSRSQHRNHLREHKCIEVGNEKMKAKPMTPPPGLKQRLIEVVNSKL